MKTQCVMGLRVSVLQYEKSSGDQLHNSGNIFNTAELILKNG